MSCKRILVGAGALLLSTLAPSGCGGGSRVCSGCTYKSKVSFSGLPTGTITTATMEVTVKHSGTCPQSGFPNNCTEVLTYDVKCKLGTARSVDIPFFIDAAPTIMTHTAKITVKKGIVTTTHAGTVDFNSNVTGGGAPPSSMPTPCPTPYLDPYSTTIPTVQ
jgi:hypothetical protein